jgi:putative FmdB family regulatory protein
MPSYDYECTACGRRMTLRQSMSDEPLRECPECGGALRRLISRGTGFVMSSRSSGSSGECSLERTGKTCCGRSERCSDPGCGKRGPG